jgi:hypothetical protein
MGYGLVPVMIVEKARRFSMTGPPIEPRDRVFVALSHTADHGRLWMAVASALALDGGRSRRAAARGLCSLAVSSFLGPNRHLIRTGEIVGRLDDPEIQSQLRTYINQLNFIATLRARQLLGNELVKDLFYEAATPCWEHCAKPLSARSVRHRTTTLPRSCRNGSGLPILESLPGAPTWSDPMLAGVTGLEPVTSSL